VASVRRLAAIMFTDIVGYTALAQENEGIALELLEQHRQLLRPIFAKHRGREVKTIGDAFLVEFGSALEATLCAIDVQHSVHSLNLERGGKLQIRVGIHVGDIVSQGNDVLGDTMNVASRIEPIAEPGGICISEPVFDQVRNKIPNELEKLEPKTLKNVRFPMDLYRVILPWTVQTAASASSAPTGLAVLPFSNISPDPNDEYFADGLTEELITVLSQLHELRVIARTSVIPYKSTPKGVAQIGAELQVASILEGSVRKAGNRLRVTAQLIDVSSQGHVWAKTYDRDLDDVFAVQAELAKQVAESLKIELRVSEANRLEARPTVRPDSYLAYLKGRTLLHHESKDTLAAAKGQFELAISLDARNAAAHAGLAEVAILTLLFPTTVSRSELEDTARRWALRAIELDPDLAEAHGSLGLCLWFKFDYAGAEREFQRAITLNPSDSRAHGRYAELLEEEERGAEGLLHHSLAEEADPLWAHNVRAYAVSLIFLGRLDDARRRIERFHELAPSDSTYHQLLAMYHLARAEPEKARAEIERTRRTEQATPHEGTPRWIPVDRAWYHAISGEREEARRILRHEEVLPDFPTSAWFIADIYAELGDFDDCFRWLEKALKSKVLPIGWFRLNPRRSGLVMDSRFHELLKKMNLA
jgi:adenylate cyclase